MVCVWCTGQPCSQCHRYFIFQVYILELESKLVKERKKLAEIRKRHYQLAAESEGWEVGLNI